MSKEPQFRYAPPLMSWDKPIEEEILAYVRSMKNQWQTQVHGNIWRSVNKAAENYVSAYAMVEKHILQEVRLRKEIANLSPQGNNVKGGNEECKL